MVILKTWIKIPELKVSLLILALPFFIFYAGKNIYKNLQPYRPQLVELINFAKEETEENERFLFINFRDSDANEAFMRMAHRDRFVSHKFVPAGGNKLYKWYDRIQKLRAVERDISLLPSLAEEYHLNYVVSPVPYRINGMEKLFHNGEYYVYKIPVK